MLLFLHFSIVNKTLVAFISCWYYII